MWNNQTGREQRQQNSPGNNELPASLLVGWQGPLCAWCLREQDLELGSGSHGICSKHAARILQQYRERRAFFHESLQLCCKETSMYPQLPSPFVRE